MSATGLNANRAHFLALFIRSVIRQQVQWVNEVVPLWDITHLLTER